ncbi:MAG: glycosyltransferase family 4 protein [Bacteroidales bacterium]|nr:glycosyltransferase family 4 protein [Bacteroidales bacterium]
MNILMTLESSFPPDKRVENEIDTLLENSFNVNILCTGKKGSLRKDTYKTASIHRIFPCFIIRKSSVAALRIPIYFVYWKLKLRQLIKKHSFDIIHIHDLPLIKPVVQLKKKFNFKIVLDLHENWPGLLNNSPFTKTLAGRLFCSISQWERYEKKYAVRADRIIVVVEEARERIIKLPVPEQKISIVSNTPNILEFNSINTDHDKPAGKKIFIYEGGITYHRGIQYVLKAFSLIESPGMKAEFWIIGKGSYLKNLKKLSNELHLDQIVKFFGWQPQDKVFEMIYKADIALIPHIKSTHTDTTVPHKLFHYMYAGLPVLASNCNPVERIIKETSSGTIYRYNDIKELAGIIQQVLSDEAFIQAPQGRKWVSRKYNWAREKEQLTGIYRHL